MCAAKCQPRGVTAKDVCRRRWILQRILLCHCDPIVPPVPLWEAAHSAAREQNHNSGMTTHTVKVLYNSVLCPCQFSIWTQDGEEHKMLIQVSIFLSLVYSNKSGHMLCFFFHSFFGILRYRPFKRAIWRCTSTRSWVQIRWRFPGRRRTVPCVWLPRLQPTSLCYIVGGCLGPGFKRILFVHHLAQLEDKSFVCRLKISYPCTWSLGLRTRCASCFTLFSGFRFHCKLQMAMLQWSKLEALPTPIEAAICWKLMFSVSSAEKMPSANPNSWILDSISCPKSPPCVSGQRQESMRYNVTGDHNKINWIHCVAKTNIKSVVIQGSSIDFAL